jgi:hypothetical protein
VTGATNSAQLPFSASFATSIKLNGGDILTAASGAVPIPGAQGLNQLVIALDQGPTTDDCVSTIYQVQNSALVPVHRYLLAPNNGGVNTNIQIEGSVFASGQNYLVGIACHHGLPGVTTALDWSQLLSPYAFVEAVTWSTPFTVQ